MHSGAPAQARARVAFQGGRYESINRLGAGKFGMCWAVTDNVEKVTKVIKQIHVGHLRADETIDALKEAALLKQLQHPFVIGYYDAFHFSEAHGQYVCIVMEFCEGGDLFEQVQAMAFQGDRFPELQLTQWFVELLQAVSYIHSRKILHRDLKSKNIFLRHGACKIGDFGIAKVLNSSSSEAQTLAGTPYYMSPECVKGSGYNAKSDIWALGVLMYELILLKVPFAATNLLELTMKICDADKPALPTRYSERFRASVEPLLVKDATMRPSADTTLATPYLLDHVRDRDTNHEPVATALHDSSLTTAADAHATASHVQSQAQSHSRSIQAALQSRSVSGPSPTGRHHSTLSTGSRERSGLSTRSRERSNVSQRSDLSGDRQAGRNDSSSRSMCRSHEPTRFGAQSPERSVTDRRNDSSSAAEADDSSTHVSFLSPRERMAAKKRQAANVAAAAMRSHVVSNATEGRSTQRTANMQLNSTTEAAALIAGGSASPSRPKDKGNREQCSRVPGDGGGDGPNAAGGGDGTAAASGQGSGSSPTRSRGTRNRHPSYTDDNAPPGSKTEDVWAHDVEPGGGSGGGGGGGYSNHSDDGYRSYNHSSHNHQDSSRFEGGTGSNSSSSMNLDDRGFRSGNIAKLRHQAQAGLGPLLYPKVMRYVRKARRQNLDDAEIAKKIGKLCKGDDSAVRAGFVADQLVLAELKHEARQSGSKASSACAIL